MDVHNISEMRGWVDKVNSRGNVGKKGNYILAGVEVAEIIKRGREKGIQVIEIDHPDIDFNMWVLGLGLVYKEEFYELVSKGIISLNKDYGAILDLSRYSYNSIVKYLNKEINHLHSRGYDSSNKKISVFSKDL